MGDRARLMRSDFYVARFAFCYLIRPIGVARRCVRSSEDYRFDSLTHPFLFRNHMRNRRRRRSRCLSLD